MPRHARNLCESQVYHIMLRGNERKPILIDDWDKQRFIDILFEKKKNREYALYSYCIMENHVHLIIKELKDPIARIIKRVATSYAYYFNKKYKRVGHVFQDRFKSQNIEDDAYLLSAVRYVHNNPQKAGICKPGDYKWCSYSMYTQILKGETELPEIKEVLKIFSNNTENAVKQFIKFSSQHGDDGSFIEMNETDKTDEDVIVKYINNQLKESGIKLEDLKKQEYIEIRNKLVYSIIKQFDISLRRLGELTGINRETIRKLSKEPSP